MQPAREATAWREKNRVLVAVYADADVARDVVKQLIGRNFPMDLISILARVHSLGDDTLGIYHFGAGERMKSWGKQGAVWGALWALVAGASGLFVLPGLGGLAAAGYIVELIVGGAAVGAGTLAGAAALSQLAVAFHRAGIPAPEIAALHQCILDGKTVVMLRGAASELAPWRQVLEAGKPLQIHDLAYARAIDPS
jgi:hypothetical protein